MQFGALHLSNLTHSEMSNTTNNTTSAPKSRLPLLAPRKSAPLASITPVIRRTPASAAPAVIQTVSDSVVPRITRSLASLPEEEEEEPMIDVEQACEDEMQALIDEEHEIRLRIPATPNLGLRGSLRNPRIRDLVKGFRNISWASNGKIRSGRITRRNKNTVSVEPFDAPAGHSATVGYGLIYDVEPQTPSMPTANDLVKKALEKATLVSWKGSSGETIKGRVIRRNDKTMSVLPLEETNPAKYWRIPYAMLTAV
jgi:hypothetical protein